MANTLLASSLDEDCKATGVNPPGCDNDRADDISTGAAYVFVRSGGTWTQQAFLKPSNTGPNDWFGSRAALSGDGNTAILNSSLEDSSGKGINGKQDDDDAPESGAVYVFTRTGTTWSQKYLREKLERRKIRRVRRLCRSESRRSHHARVRARRGRRVEGRRRESGRQLSQRVRRGLRVRILTLRNSQSTPNSQLPTPNSQNR